MTNIPRFSAPDILFIFIDLQQSLLERIEGAKKIEARNIMLYEASKVLKIPSIVTTQYQKGLGGLAKDFGSRAEVEVLDKTTFSCSGDPAFPDALARHSGQWVAISGVETHICVTQTALDLLREGRQVAVVADAVGARSELDHALGLKRMEKSGALLVTAEMLIYELLGRADRPEFKQILPLIK